MKSIKYIFAAALAVLACGCNKEQASEAVPDGTEVGVTFAAELPGMQTKAIGDGLTANKLSVAVYEDNAGAPGAYIADLDKDATFTALKTSVDFKLVKGKTYHFIFWAAAVDNPYTFDKAGKAVTVNYSRAAANNEARDAFYAVKTLKVQGPATEPVQLKRPFAQVNFGTTEADFTAAEKGGVTVTKSAAIIAEAATVLDLFAGEGKTAEEVTFAAEAIPVEKLKLKDGTEYKYLSMNYFVPEGKFDENHVTNVKAQFVTDNSQVVEISVPSAPVQSNWRTNIVGNLLTDQVVFNVEIVPAFEDETTIDLENITTAAGLRTAFANGHSAKLAADITIDGTISVPAGKNVVLDLDGHKITNTSAAIAIKVDGNLEIKGNGTVDGGDGGDNQAVHVNATGKLVIRDGHFTVGPDATGLGNSCVECWGGSIEIYGGYFRTEAAFGGKYYVLNQKNNQPGTITVYGGQFENYDPATGDDNLGGNFLAPGYFSKKISASPDVYEVTAAPTFVVKTAEELKTMLTTLTSAGAGNNTVEIAQDIQLAAGETWVPVKVDGYNGAGVITVKGNGHTIKGLNSSLFDGGFAGKSGIVVTDLTIEDVTIVDSANSLGIGAFVNTIDSMERIELINCHLLNSSITSTGGARVGGLIGWTSGYDNPNDGPVDTYVKVINCSVEGCEITANGSVGGIIGHAGSNAATYQTIEGCTVKDCVLKSTDAGDWRVGVVVGTANVGQLTINNTTATGNSLQQRNISAMGQLLYGRFVPGTTGKLTIDGVDIQ